ncbi:hypothetical protein BDW62DRAFT_177404 [Aspergillus aurantiobrunneus]
MSAPDCSSASSSCHFTCPRGGTWYVCPDEPYFVGCCSSDPCTNANTTSPCPDTYAASFDTDLFDSIRPNTCIEGSNSDWYTCNFTSPPFVGCCASNACGQTEGCPDDDVLPAAWSSSRSDQFELFMDEDVDSPNGDDGDGGLSGGAIAGIVVGAVAGVVILLAALWFVRRRRKAKSVEGPMGHMRSSSGVPGEQQNLYTGEYGYQYQHPTSPYQDSQSSPGQLNSKYPSGSSAGFSAPGLSPPLPSKNGRPISEMYTHTGSDERGSTQAQGLGVFGATQNPGRIPELDSTAMPSAHELDGGDRA